MKVILRDRYFIPAEGVDKHQLRRHTEVKFVTKAFCRPKCPIARQQGRYCSTCPSRDAKIRMWSKVVTKQGRTLIAIPAGNDSILKKVVTKPVEIIDRRTNPPMRSKLKWTGKLRRGEIDAAGKQAPNQKQLLDAWRLKVQTDTAAIIVALPRTGKTVIGVAASIAERSRTFITGSQSRFLHQFGMTYGRMTNVKEYYNNGRFPVVLVDPKGWPDAENYGIKVVKKWGKEVERADVVLSTYQQFISEKGKQRLRNFVDGKFGLFIVDEAHTVAAPCFSRVVHRTNSRRKLALTATLTRKDGLTPVVQAVFGSVASVSKATATIPNLKLFETGVVAPRDYKQWAYMEKFLTTNEGRNKLIVQRIFADLRANPKHSILIPTTRIQHNETLVRMINAQAEYCRKHKGEDWPAELAVSYRGGKDITTILKRVDSGDVRVTVATYSMVKYGIDVQRWTHVYLGIVPTSNAANAYQALNRVCTPYTPQLEAKIGSKPTPVVRFVIDEMPASIYCFIKLWKNPNYGLLGALTGKNYYGVKLARMDQQSRNRAEDIVRFPKSYSAQDAGINKLQSKTSKGFLRRGNSWAPERSGIMSF